MNYTLSVTPTCGKEGECKLAKACSRIEAKPQGSYVALTDRDEEVRTEIEGIAGQRTRNKPLSACTEARNPLKGKSIPLSWGKVTYLRAA